MSGWLCCWVKQYPSNNKSIGYQYWILVRARLYKSSCLWCDENSVILSRHLPGVFPSYWIVVGDPVPWEPKWPDFKSNWSILLDRHEFFFFFCFLRCYSRICRCLPDDLLFWWAFQRFIFVWLFLDVCSLPHGLWQRTLWTIDVIMKKLCFESMLSS